MNVNPAELRRIADKLDGALDAYRAAHYRYPTVPNHVETAFLSIADDLDDLLESAPTEIDPGALNGPRVATFIKQQRSGGGADQRLYRLSPPLVADSWTGGEPNSVAWQYVVTSAVDVSGSGPETYIFGADEAGEIIEWGELPGSFRGALDHAEALARAGYTMLED